MNTRPLSIILLLLLTLILVACTATSETEPAVAGPTETFSTAIPATEEPTATAEPIEPTSTIEETEPTALPPTETAEPEPDELIALDLCADFPRPAMLLMQPDESYHLYNPASGESCPLPILNTVPGMVVPAQKDFFVAIPATGGEGRVTIIMRYREDGVNIEDLPYTVINSEVGASLTGFTVSDDGRLIAWSSIGPTAGSDFPAISLSIADTETGQVLGGIAPEAEAAPRAFEPIRFSEDGSILYYALQPYGIGGRWTSFNARYDNLYAFTTDGTGQPELIFDCAELGLGLCLGDFTVVDNTVTTLAYVDQKANTVVVQNNTGDILNTFEDGEEYVGYPTFGPGGEFVYFTADLSDDPNSISAIETGTLHRSAPVIHPAETLASDPALLLPLTFFSENQVIVNWFNEDDSWGLALIGLDGSIQNLDLPTGTTLLGVSAVSPLISSLPTSIN